MTTGSPESRKAATERYLTLLKSGGNDHPMAQLKKAGVDLTQRATIQAVIDQMDRLVSQMESRGGEDPLGQPLRHGCVEHGSPSRLLAMNFRVILPAAAIALTCLSASALAAPASAPHAAACVAALKAQEAELAESVKAGEPREPVLLKVVRSGIAIIGTQYLAGVQEAEARELLKAAERDFQALAPAVEKSVRRPAGTRARRSSRMHRRSSAASSRQRRSAGSGG